jgi:hypothetical protein
VNSGSVPANSKPPTCEQHCGFHRNPRAICLEKIDHLNSDSVVGLVKVGDGVPAPDLYA